MADDFASPSRVLDPVSSQLLERGKLRFRDFMELALYGPSGYYTRADSRIGPDGDFVTAPEWSPALGACLGRLAATLAAFQGGQPSIVELGAGRGRLIAPLLEQLELQTGLQARAALQQTIRQHPRPIAADHK